MDSMKTVSRDFLRALPKCEHHCHLEGTLTPSVLFSLAKQNKIDLPHDDPAYSTAETLAERYKRFESLDDFLRYYQIGMTVLKTSNDFEALAWNYFQQANDDGVQHAELSFDPQAHTVRGVGYMTIIDGVNIARKKAFDQFGITSELICCFLRHFPASECLSAFQHETFQASFMGDLVKGIGLSSTEKGFQPQLYREIYEQAKAVGLRLTAHAGEDGPPENVTNSIEQLGVERIDHGIALAQNNVLVNKVAASGVMLTVCPVSNVVLKCVGDISEVPIRKFLKAGIKFSINSDDPAYFGEYILGNYYAVQDAFNLTVDEWGKICKDSIEGSWCGDKRKSDLHQILERVIGTWKDSRT